MCQYFTDVILVARNLAQGDGVGGIAVEAFLVQIDPGSRDGAADMDAGQVVFNQRAANLFVFPLDIVGPIDGDAFRIAGQHVIQGQGSDL